ncbi:MAG TPA: glycosyltransferase, partial [Candidatus Poseidoniales archaeon]
MRTALLLIGFNRVDYFDETLTSLEANPEAHDCDLHVYLDGGPKANQEALRKRIDSSSFENITVVARDENWGIGRHLIDARRRLFDQQNYDRVLLFEDDMVLAPSYVATLLNMMDWSMDYNDIGTVMAYNINHDAAEIQASQTNEVIATNRHFWGYGMAKSVWDDIKSVVYEFEQRYLTDVAYADRSHRSIRWRFIRSV